MSRTLKTLVLASAALLLSLTANAQQTAEKAVSEETKEVFETIARWAEAVQRRDEKGLDLIFDEYLIVTTPDGKTRGKKEELELLKPNPNVTATKVRNDDIKVRVFGDAALATGLAQMSTTTSGGENRTAFRYTAMFIRKDGRWQLAALHTSSPLKQ